jgi:hypothetical protein
MIKNNEIAWSSTPWKSAATPLPTRAIRTSSLLARVTTFTTIAGAEAAVEGMKYMDNLGVISVQEMHASWHEANPRIMTPTNTAARATPAVSFCPFKDGERHGHHSHHQARRRKAQGRAA